MLEKVKLVAIGPAVKVVIRDVVACCPAGDFGDPINVEKLRLTFWVFPFSQRR